MADGDAVIFPPQATTAQARRALQNAFTAAGIINAAQEARLLLRHASGLSHSDMIIAAQERLPDRVIDALTRYAEDRLKRNRPISDLLGFKDFWKDRFIISKDVLTPRPETEGIIEVALTLFPTHSPLKILDLGTGSGAVLLSLLREFPNAFGVGVDISPSALKIAARNSAALKLDCELIAGNWLDPIDTKFDLIVSNPPYISHAEMETLPTDVTHFDPDLALRGGQDGLDPYRDILSSLSQRELLVPGGAIIFEVGRGQSQDVAALIQECGRRPTIYNDLSGIERILCGQ